MKKILSVLLVLCIAATLFAAAGVTVKVGSAFAFFNGKSVKDTNEPYNPYYKFKGHGFGFDVEGQYDISDKFMVFASYGKVFPTDVYATIADDETSGTWELWADSLKKLDPEIKYDFKMNFMDVTAGVAYKFDFNAFKLAVGGGVSFNRLLVKTTNTPKDPSRDDYTEELKETLSNIAVLGYVEAKYLVSQNVGITLTAKPQLNIFSFYNYYIKNKGMDASGFDRKGISLGFAMPVALGVSYSF